MDKGFWHAEFAYVVREKMGRQHQLPLGHVFYNSAYRICICLVLCGLTFEDIHLRNLNGSYIEPYMDKPKFEDGNDS